MTFKRVHYRLMGSRFDPDEEAARHLREFAACAPACQAQMRDMFHAFLDNAGFPGSRS